ncbi:unnamed protein product [Oikopleura dioica]|uniref:Uncharacterized protein n=1 Tax=Oikopleura dioica TaxID=34765 RepID=E4YEV7_OIKDI|nr:unnamed protein product [Oikopleura dioica]
MVMTTAYAVCTAVICLEVTVILGLVLFLLRPQKDTAQLQPDAGNVKTEFTPAEEEAPPREVEYRIEYNDSEQDDELNQEEDVISRGPPSEPESDTPAFTTIAATIALPTKPQRRDSTSSSSSASSMPPAKVDSPKLMRSDSSASSASSNADLMPKLIPEMPGIDESDIISGADDVEVSNGWRRTVKLSSLQRSGIIKREQINDFLIGDISKDKLQHQYVRWLKGEEPIAGILFPDTGLKKSIFTAQKEEYISRSTAISLLEAQAATGNIIDPISARKMSVTEAAQDGQFDKIYEQCLLRAERAVTGYKQGGYNTRLSDEKLSIFEAMTKGLVVEEHAIRLLEAQIATGGVIDVRSNHRVPIQYALKMGLIDERIYRIIADKPTTTNFEDPNSTKTPPEKVSYSQLLANSIIDDDTGLRLFLFQKPGFEKTQSHTSSPQSMRSAKSSSSSIASIGSVSSKNKELEAKEEEEIKPFPVDDDIPTVEKIDSVSTEQDEAIPAVDEVTAPTLEDSKSITSSWRKQCAIVDLVDAGLMAESKVKKIESGHLLMAEAENELQQWLHGSSPIAGLLIISTGEKMSLYSAAKRGFLRRGTAISLLEAQAATGNVIDPITGEYMAVEEATRKGLIDRQYEAILSRAEKAVYGYKSKFNDTLLSVYQALQKGMLVENHAIRLLEAQIVTGGVIDPHRHHRCPIELAIKRGLFDEKLKVVLEGVGDDTKGFFDPNTEQNLNYSELVEQCVTDAETGLLLLPYKKKPPEEKLSGPLAKVLFESELRRKVTLQDVVDADLIEPETLRRFKSGEMSAHEVKQLVDSLKIHVEGSMPIAGVINAENGQRLSIFQATQAGLIRKGTAYELLEAQASCGKIVDVQTGRVLSVETASKTGVFDAEYEDVVMRASRAVTGYREPFKKEILSLCEAISRHLVVERNGVRLLEAQVATGGIIDMKSPLRLSIEAALRKGLLESRLAKQLQARTSKSYFDPNTGENLNYAQLMERCITDPDTGMLFLEVEVSVNQPIQSNMLFLSSSLLLILKQNR